MRRFSERNSLITLNEINITPLLDLAFAPLIIFVITRPLLEGNIDLKLPEVGQANPRNLDKRDIRVVEIKANGEYFLAGKRVTIRQLENSLVQDFQKDPKLIVDLRVDKAAPWEYPVAVLEACTRNHITQISERTAPVPGR